MWPDEISNPGPLTYESGALPNALCGPAKRAVRERKYWADQSLTTVSMLTLKVPIMTAADDIHKYFFIVFQRK